MDLRKELVSLLAEGIERKSVTMYRIAKDTGISAILLSRIVNKEQSFSLKTAQKLIDYLDIKFELINKSK